MRNDFAAGPDCPQSDRESISFSIGRSVTIGDRLSTISGRGPQCLHPTHFNMACMMKFIITDICILAVTRTSVFTSVPLEIFSLALSRRISSSGFPDSVASFVYLFFGFYALERVFCVVNAESVQCATS